MSIKADVSKLTKQLQDAQRKQIPFATSVAINETLKDMRTDLMRGMGQDLDRPTPFTVKGVQYKRSTKGSLTGVLFIEAKRAAYLKYQVSGGVRRPRRKVIIVGMTETNQYGNTPGFRRFRTRLLAKKNHFEATINGTSGIWKRSGRKGESLQLVALYTPKAQYEKRFRFHERAQRSAQTHFRAHFNRALTRALATAK